jgi:hypothetical protein
MGFLEALPLDGEGLGWGVVAAGMGVRRGSAPSALFANLGGHTTTQPSSIEEEG